MIVTIALNLLSPTTADAVRLHVFFIAVLLAQGNDTGIYRPVVLRFHE